jgi:hypothetical protein
MLTGIAVDEWAGQIRLTENSWRPKWNWSEARISGSELILLFFVTKKGTLNIHLKADGGNWLVYTYKEGQGQSYAGGLWGGGERHIEIQVERGQLMIGITKGSGSTTTAEVEIKLKEAN